jgi:hypothetical protein
LATGVRALVDRPALAKALGLKEHHVILLAQCVGRPSTSVQDSPRKKKN